MDKPPASLRGWEARIGSSLRQAVGLPSPLGHVILARSWR